MGQLNTKEAESESIEKSKANLSLITLDLDLRTENENSGILFVLFHPQARESPIKASQWIQSS